ncbi:MAG: ankyrin repeat domain-containing protein [Acidobacteriota bacterium]
MPTRHAIRLVLLLLLAGAAWSCSGRAGQSEQAFCDAVSRGDATAARSLLASDGFNVRARDLQGDCQPIMVAFRQATPRKPEFTALALEILKRPGTSDATWTTPHYGGRSGQSSTGSPLIAAAANGNAPLVKAIIEAGVDIRDTQGRAALTDAVYQRSLEIVQIMVEAGANPTSALLTAIVTRNREIIAYAESKGGRENGPAVLVAARRGDLAALDAAIAERANLEVEDVTGLTPIMRAAVFGHPDAVTRLAAAGANVNHMAEGMTALHFAAEAGDAPTIEALVAAKANIEARGDQGWPTPLLWAASQGSSAGVHALVAAGANGQVFKAGDKPALSHAVEQGRITMVRDLLKGGARPNERVGEGWQPPLHVALAHCGKLGDGSGDDSDYHVDLLRALVDAGADRSARDAAGLTPAAAAEKRLAEATHPYYKQCFGAKAAYLRALK